MIILSDNPIRDASGDEFGYRAHAEVLCEAMVRTADLPLTLGVFGPWGSGKTSFLTICRDLLHAQGVTTVSFNPWKYDKRDEVWHALIQTLLDELAHRARDSVEPTVRARLQGVVARIRRLSLTATWMLTRQLVTMATPLTVSDSDVDQLRTAWTGEEPALDQTAEYHLANRFDRDFAELVTELTGDYPVAVFIDDLDRCRPESALSVLEALRIFTGDAPCLFVIAMDQGALVDAAARHFDGDRVRGRWYLEKLVHFSYHLPGVRYESLANALRPKLEFLADDPALWEIVRISFQNNPRRIRRFVSSLNLTLGMLSRVGPQSTERMRQVALLLMLRQEHPEFFARLRTDPGTWTSEAVPQLADDDAGLRAVLQAVSDRSRFPFPPPPPPDLVLMLSEVLVMNGLALGAAG